jgi:hypothetical protein
VEAQTLILGELNQQDALSTEKCSSSQNGRGGTSYIIRNKTLFDGITNLIKRETAGVAP